MFVVVLLVCACLLFSCVRMRVLCLRACVCFACDLSCGAVCFVDVVCVSCDCVVCLCFGV